MSSTRHWQLAAGTLLALSLTACGSRADFTALGTSADDGSGPAITGPGAPSASATPGGSLPSTTGGRTGTSSNGTTGLGGTTGATTGTTTGSTSGAGTTTGVGGPVNKAPIRLAYIIQGTAGVSALTGSNVSSGDGSVNTEEMNALVSYANAHGGVGGRKISAQGFKSEATSQQADRLALCKQITEDYKAEVLLDQNQFLTEEAWACFAQHKVNFFGLITSTDRKFQQDRAPYLTTTWLSEDRSMQAMVAGGQNSGWFKGGRVGILLSDVPTSHRLYDTVLKPALARVGITNQLVRYITLQDGGAQTQQTQSAEIAFQTATPQVNRILFLHDIIVYEQFTGQAVSQNYHPWYEFSDVAGMTGVAAFYGKGGVNNNAIAVSSSPSFVPENASTSSSDTTAVIDRAGATPAVRRCLDILSKQTGKNYYDPNASGDSLANWIYYCDEFFLWWEGANKVGNSYTPRSFGGGLSDLGRSYLSTLQNSTDYGQGFFDGASTYRVGRFNASCNCFPKITGWLPI